MNKLHISTRIYLGFGLVLVLALIIAGVGYFGIKQAEETFATYRTLARQTNADGRVQANMLTTRIFAKNFVIDANAENIEGVRNRAEKTLELIRESLNLTSLESGRHILIEDLEGNLQRYVEKFQEVTELQQQRNVLVNQKLNVLGPIIEKKLTEIMKSAVKDGDTDAAFQAGITLRSLLLGRLYANRFLIENSESSRARAIREFRDLDFHQANLASQLENPQRKELAKQSFDSQLSYLAAFDKVHQVITERNNIIQHELDRIGPAVAQRIERLKLSIKQEQDQLGPAAQKSLNQSLILTSIVSILALIFGVVAALLIGAGITRPLKKLTSSAVAMEDGDMTQEIEVSGSDEVSILAQSFSSMRDSIVKQVSSLEKEIAERSRAEKELAETHDNLEKIVHERTVELATARDDAQMATKAKGEFLASMSHEIRTPMNGVIGMIDLIKQTRMTRDQSEMVDTVRTSAFALLTIINDILDFSKIEAGKLTLEAAPLSTCDLVEGVVQTLAPNTADKGIEIYTYIDPAIPDGVLGDSVRLRQILFNLCGNAVKFTEKGHVAIRAERLSADSDENVTIRFQVIDTGIGVPAEAQKTLFDAFTQAESSTTRRYGGTGLGLTISQRLVGLMKGKLEVESTYGRGSCFSVTVTFPVAADHQIKSDGYDLSGKKILLSMENPILQGSLPRYLDHWGANTTVQPNLELVEHQIKVAAETGAPFDILYFENVGFRSRTDVIRNIQKGGISEIPNFVLQVDQRIKSREDLEDTVYTVQSPIKRGIFLRSIAAAVGLASPDLEYDDLEEMPINLIEPPSIEEAEANGQLILLAEDNITNQRVIERQLNSLGYAVIIAGDGELALEKLDQHSFAVLLTDCHMPNMDGFELTAKIRERDHNGKRIPIVAITASALGEEVELCYEAGMDDFLSKPVEIAKLGMTLKKWMPEPLHRPGATKTPLPVDKKTKKQSKPKRGSKRKPPIDYSFLEQTFGDDTETITEILKEFVEPSRECCSEVDKAMNDGQIKEVAAGAHKLKSAARSIGANNVADTCEKLELAGTNDDWESIKTLAPQLNKQMGMVIQYIDQL